MLLKTALVLALQGLSPSAFAGAITDAAPAALKGPSPVKLADLGGAYSYRIPHFQSFPQEQDEWCWAATAETIYFAMTGLHLEQSALSRLQNDDRNLPPQETMKGFLGLDPESCEGDEDSDRCNHPGNPSIALDFVGASYPFEKYPNLDDSPATYLLIKESLSKDIPVGIRIVWPDGGGHLIVVFGATYAASPDSTGNAKVTLDIYDPYDDTTSTMGSNEYEPAYQNVIGTWDGRIALGNFDLPKPVAATPSLCSMLSPADQAICK